MRKVLVSGGLAILASAALLASAGPTGAAGESSGPAATPSSSDQEASRIRSVLGLSTSEDSIRAAKADTQGRIRFGTRVTNSEGNELDRREDASEASGMLAARLAETDDTYGGTWIDDRGTIHLSFTRQVSGQERSELLRTFAPGTPLSLDVVANSWQRLTGLQKNINRDLQALDSAGVDVASSTAMDRDNYLEVRVRGNLNRARGVLKEKYATTEQEVHVLSKKDEVVFQTNRDIHSGPAYGGIWTEFNNINEQCTIGYSKMRSNSVATDNYMGAAGHCAPSGGTSHMGLGQATILANVHANKFSGTTSTCDCMIVGPIPGGRVTNSVLLADNTPYFYTTTATSSIYGAGRTYYASGAATAQDRSVLAGPAKVLSSSYSFRDSASGISFSDFVRMDRAVTAGGDSGAPWGSDRYFAGIHSNLNDGTSNFSKAANFSTLNVTPNYAKLN